MIRCNQFIFDIFNNSGLWRFQFRTELFIHIPILFYRRRKFSPLFHKPVTGQELFFCCFLQQTSSSKSLHLLFHNWEDFKNNFSCTNWKLHNQSINLFVTSKNETTNSPIHQFRNLKCCKMSLKNEKARLKMFFKVINKK